MPVEMESSCTQMETFTKANGRTTSATDTEFTPIKKVQDTKATGRMTHSREKAPRSGLKAANTLDSTKTARNKDMELTHGPTAPSMKATGSITESMALDITNGRMGESTSATGTTTTCTEWAFISTRIMSLTRGSSKRTKRQDMVCTTGMTEENMKDGGTMESNTALASTRIQAKEKSSMASGSTANA